MGKPQVEVGMRVAFYVYPCLLFVVLLGIQAFQYYREHRQSSSESATSDQSKRKPASLNQTQVWLIWILQLALSCLLLGSIIFTVRGVLSRGHDETGSVEFPLSSYVVSTMKLIRLSDIDAFFFRFRHLMSECFSTFWLACFPTRKAHGHLASLIAAAGSQQLLWRS